MENRLEVAKTMGATHTYKAIGKSAEVMAEEVVASALTPPPAPNSGYTLLLLL